MRGLLRYTERAVTIVYLSLAWLAGIWLAGQFSSVGHAAWLGSAAVCLLAAVIFRQRPRLRLGLVCAGCLALGAARFQAALPPAAPSQIGYYNGHDEVVITGMVAAEPQVSDRSVTLRLRVEQVTRPGGQGRPVTGDVRVTTPRFPVIPYGARVRVVGRLSEPADDNPFCPRYFYWQGYQSCLGFTRPVVLSEGNGHPFLHALYDLKARALATLNRLLPDPQAAVLSGILLGTERAIPIDLLGEFRRTGTSHLLVVSGYNVAVLVAAVTVLAEPLLGRRWAVVGALVAIAPFVVIVGNDASALRAAFLAAFYLIPTRLLGRPTFTLASLMTAAWLMTLLQPFILWSISFQLSFAATLGLILHAGRLSEWAQAHRPAWARAGSTSVTWGLLVGGLAVTLVAQVWATPLLMAYSGQFSVDSLLVNALILPAQPAIMATGGLAVLGGLVALPVGQLFGRLAWLGLTYTIGLVHLFAQLPFVSVAARLGPAGVVAAYILLLAWPWLIHQGPAIRSEWGSMLKQPRRQWALWLSGAAVTVIVLAWGLTQPDGRLHVVFLDVGQGDAIFIQTPGGRQLLVDGGLYPTLLNAHLGRQMPFWDRAIDLVVATHGDADHAAGLPGVLERYQVGQLITNGESGLEEPMATLLNEAAETHAPVHVALAGEVMEMGDGVRIEVLHPAASFDADNRNDHSIVLRLVYGRFSLLLTGDAEEAAEAALLASGRPLTAVVLKAGHHGSNSSSGAPFLAAVRPQFVVISVGAENEYGHPHPEMLQRVEAMGAAVLRTDELGAIEIISDGEQMWWRTTLP
ncbi:MAG: DNA internalization-related competence protein ComEC/Rec2 [Chloroflexota bacterium]